MSWKLKRKAQSLLAGEEGQVHKDWGGRMSIALVYPNSYAVGMSNLGFQTIYEHLNAVPDVVCERVFFPDPEDLEEQRRSGTAPFSLESLRPLRDFDLIGFSVTYEGDYINTVRLLGMSGIPLRAAERGRHDSIVVMGGVFAFSNPEPVAAVMDAVAVGDGGERVGEIVEAWRASGAEDARGRRRRFLERLAGLAGIYVPGAYDVGYALDGTIEAVRPRAARASRPVLHRRAPAA